MFETTNFGSFFLRSGKSRELADTKRAWKQVERARLRSPLATGGPHELAIEIAQEVLIRSERHLSMSLVMAIQNTAEELLRAERIGEIEPLWDAVTKDVEAGVQFRQMLTIRGKWTHDFKRMHRVFSRTLVSILLDVIHSLPREAFDEDISEETLEVPLVDLMHEPAAVVERAVLAAFEAEATSLGIFGELRLWYERLALVASGYSPSDDVNAVGHKLILPTAQKGKTNGQLISLYLQGTPLAPLLNTPVPFRIPGHARFEHCHVVGGTGHGKTQLLQKLIHTDLVASLHERRSIVVIDSQGDLINKLVRLDLFAPGHNSLAERLVLIDPTDVEYPAALNLFDQHLDRVRSYRGADRERVLNGVIELYELFFGAFLGAELTQKQGVIFKYLAHLMLAIPDATIRTLMEVMDDGASFRPYMQRLEGSARLFFEKEFFSPAFAATKKQILRRLWGVLSTPAFERMLTQPTNKLDLFSAMNEGKIILVNTAKDLLKRDGSELFGRFFIAMIAQAALERSTLPEKERTPTFVYVDEAHEYFDDSIETILNQARKYRVGLTLAHQTLDQLSPRLRSVILSNTSTKCVGGVSAKDAHALAEEMHTTPEFLQSMRRRDGVTEFAIWVKQVTPQALRITLPLGFLERQPTLTEEEYDTLRTANRVRYCGQADLSTFATPSTPTSTEPVAASDEGSVASPRAPRAPTHEMSLLRRKAHDLGKGGGRHRYLQALVKELAEQYGFKATIEAPVPSGGQVDVLVEASGAGIAFEISVSTDADHEIANVKKCLAAGYNRLAVVLAKSKSSAPAFRATLLNAVSEINRERITFLAPEEIPDFLATLLPKPEPTERVVKGYKVRGSITETTLEEAKARREAVAKLLARSLASQRE